MTIKFLIELQNGKQIETVLIRHKDTRSGGHSSVCISSQVGCSMNCRFCDTGSIGLRYNLTSGEILEQFWHAQNSISDVLRNIVFMGMGEPLDNWKNVRNAIKGFHDRKRFNLSYRKITLSTVGIFSKIKIFSNTFPEVNLALSLHAPTQKLRIQIVPSSKSYSVSKLFKAVQYHIFKTNKKVFIEYICIGNINCSIELQHKLGILFQTVNPEKILINLIPYNTTKIGDSYKFVKPNNRQLKQFKKTIISYGLFCTIRRSTISGQDINGACGQLIINKKKIFDYFLEISFYGLSFSLFGGIMFISNIFIFCS